MSEDSLKGYDHDAEPSDGDAYICKHCGLTIHPNIVSDLPEDRLYPLNEELDRKIFGAYRKCRDLIAVRMLNFIKSIK